MPPFFSTLLSFKTRTRLVVSALLGCAPLLALALSGGASSDDDRSVRVGDAQSGGVTTVFVTNHDAFARPLANLPMTDLRQFTFGNKLFNTNWVEAPASVHSLDGLGPVFNRSSCSGCHMRDGRGRPPEPSETQMMSMLLRLSHLDPKTGAALPHPDYGDQLNPFAIGGVPPEGHAVIRYRDISGRYADGTTYTLQAPRYRIEAPLFGIEPLDPQSDPQLVISPRVAPAVFGLGLLAAIPQARLREWADPEDRDGDGISGRMNWITDTTGQKQIGRFGWKANVVSLRQQNAGAALGDIGLTSSLRPNENCMPRQTACQKATSGGSPELNDTQLDKLTFYTQTLAPPARRDVNAANIIRGGHIFEHLNCSGCHRPSVKTGDSPIPALAHQQIQPFTDLLLHDMGEALADHRPDGSATGREWRTAPLWGIGLVPTVNHHTRYLHDGRARSIEEAILWHGGEAEASTAAFKKLTLKEREDLLAFLNSL